VRRCGGAAVRRPRFQQVGALLVGPFVGVASMFWIDRSLSEEKLVELVNDRDLQAATIVAPLRHMEGVDRWSPAPSP
jgi:hypothetical protein